MSRVHDALSRSRATAGAGDAPAVSGEAPAGAPLFPLEGTDAQATWLSEGEQRSHAPDVAERTGSPEVAERTGAAEVAERTGSPDEPVFSEVLPTVAEKLVLSPAMDSSSIEQYRRLAGRLHLAQAEHGIKVVMVASALPGEGKTLTAANLALTLSESYHRDVLLIDGDLRRPSIHDMFRVSNVSGLNDGVGTDAARKVPLVRWSDHLTLITAGRPDSDPMKVLISAKMRKVITEAAARFQWVIIDTPPVGLLTDASLFSAMVDATVLVVQAGRTQHADIQRAVQAIGRDRIFGVVLNRARTTARAGYADYPYRDTVESAVQ
jgi:protein-tyrosine kinase